MGTDGRKWAEELYKLANSGVLVIDVGLLTSWFANAIEAGRDAGATVLDESLGKQQAIAAERDAAVEREGHLHDALRESVRAHEAKIAKIEADAMSCIEDLRKELAAARQAVTSEQRRADAQAKLALASNARMRELVKQLQLLVDDATQDPPAS